MINDEGAEFKAGSTYFWSSLLGVKNKIGNTYKEFPMEVRGGVEPP